MATETVDRVDSDENPSLICQGVRAISATNHCSFYPGAFPVAAHADALTAYNTGRGTIRFQPDRPLSSALVRKLVKTRIAERGLGRAKAAS